MSAVLEYDELGVGARLRDGPSDHGWEEIVVCTQYQDRNLQRSKPGQQIVIASVYSYRGDRSEALKWLDRAYQQRDPNLYFVKWNPFLKNLEGDPRCKAFLRKMNLPGQPRESPTTASTWAMRPFVI